MVSQAETNVAQITLASITKTMGYNVRSGPVLYVVRFNTFKPGALVKHGSRAFLEFERACNSKLGLPLLPENPDLTYSLNHYSATCWNT